ncbi:MAG: hypothetical protein RLZZ15_444 [Verrucomicrobiota bacterium]|jgi:gamma-glutamylcyclotransferase (GGCT)/AIG2-like uncharacterized protein YtfP
MNSPNAATLLFVYGTLKHGCSNHAQLAGAEFVGPARTPPGFRLHDLGGFPGLAPHADDRDGVVGEVWRVDGAGLARLDRFEGVAEGLYARRPIALLPPFAGEKIAAYLPVAPPVGRRDLGAEWVE